MPARLVKACKVLGCPHLAPCPEHGRAAVAYALDRRRGSAASRGYDHRWRVFAAWYFGELYRLRVPRAGLCGGRHPAAPATADSACASTGAASLATLVDHIAPIAGKADPRRFDLANLQGLCDTCHNRKRQREATAARRHDGR